MILLLGATGYIGEAFARALRDRKQEFIALSRKQFDYTRFDVLLEFLRKNRPTFLVNAAGYTGRPNVDAPRVAIVRPAQAPAQAALFQFSPGGPGSSSPFASPGAGSGQNMEQLAEQLGWLRFLWMGSLLWNLILLGTGITEIHGVSGGAAFGAIVITAVLSVIIGIGLVIVLGTVMAGFVASMMSGLRH